MQWKTAVWSIQICINFAAKVASNAKFLKRDHVNPLLRNLKWINFNNLFRLNEPKEQIFERKICTCQQMQMWKMMINFDLRNKVLQWITKDGSDVHMDYRRKAVGQKAVSVSGAKLWNSIQMNIRNSNTIVTFKSHMYQHLLEHQ